MNAVTGKRETGLRTLVLVSKLCHEIGTCSCYDVCYLTPMTNASVALLKRAPYSVFLELPSIKHLSTEFLTGRGEEEDQINILVKALEKSD